MKSIDHTGVLTATTMMPPATNRSTNPSPPQAHPGSPAGPRRVIVAGYGPVGRVVSQQLERDGLVVKIIEMNLDTIERQLTLDKDVIYGDVCDPQILERAGIHEAEALILTIPNEQAALRACRTARTLAPRIFIAARTNHMSQGMLATKAGADKVIVEEIVTAEAMRDAVCGHLTAQAQSDTPND